VIRILGNHGISIEEFNKSKKKKTKQYGFKPSDNDIVWELLNKRLLELMKTSDINELRGIYYGMAKFGYEEGKSFIHLLKEASKCELIRYKESEVVSKVQILAADNSCDEFKELNGKQFTIEETLETMPLPNLNCTWPDVEPGWCRCTYLPIVDDN
jgi:hypothetical protein